MEGDLFARGTRGLRRPSFDVRSRGHPYPSHHGVSEEESKKIRATIRGRAQAKFSNDMIESEIEKLRDAC